MNKQEAMDIDWSKAPEDATHYANGLFYKISDSIFWFDPDENLWRKNGNSQKWIDKNLIPRPSEPQW